MLSFCRVSLCSATFTAVKDSAEDVPETSLSKNKKGYLLNSYGTIISHSALAWTETQLQEEMPLVLFPVLWNVHIPHTHASVARTSVECLWRAFITFASNCYLEADRCCYCTGGWIIGFVMSRQTYSLTLKALYQVWSIQMNFQANLILHIKNDSYYM